MFARIVAILNGFLNRIFMPEDWSPKSNGPELASKVIVVTGGNAGLGYETVLQLARREPERIYMTARSKDKFDAAMKKITQEIPSAGKFIRFIQMDLASLSSVRRAASEIILTTKRLDILINNAGIMGAPAGQTQDGYEIHFGTNHMGHALFTKLLLPLLERTVSASVSGSNTANPRSTTAASDVRIIVLSSVAYTQAPGAKSLLDEASIKSPMSSTMMMSKYAQSKFANVLHARELARRYPNITSVSIHPGRVATGLLDDMYARGRSLYGMFQSFYDYAIGTLSVEEGAWNQVWAATVSKEQLKNGGYYVPVGQFEETVPMANDEVLARKLWEWQEREFDRLEL